MDIFLIGFWLAGITTQVHQTASQSEANLENIHQPKQFNSAYPSATYIDIIELGHYRLR